MFKAFSSHTLKSSTYGVSKYSSDCISVTMQLVLDAFRVAMGTFPPWWSLSSDSPN